MGEIPKEINDWFSQSAEVPCEDFIEAFHEALAISETEQQISALERTPSLDSDQEINKQGELKRLKAALKDQHVNFEARNIKICPEEYIAKLMSEGMKDYQIAAKLSDIYKLSTFQIGILLPAIPGNKIDPESISKRGRRLLAKNKIKG